MLKRYQDTVVGFSRLFDAAIVVACWLASYGARFFLPPFEVTKGLPAFATYAALTPLIAAIWLACFRLMRVYELHPAVERVRHIGLVLKAHGVAIALFIAITYVFEDYRYSRLVMVYFGSLAAIALVLSQMLLRVVTRRILASGGSQRNVVAIGEGKLLEDVLNRLASYEETGLSVRGVVSRDGSPGDYIAGEPVLGCFRDLPTLLREANAHEVVIALPPEQHQELYTILEVLKNEMISIRLIPDVQRYAALSCETENFEGLPIVHLNDSPLEGLGAAAKRVTDVVLSALGLLLLSPLLLLIALLVKATSRGPILYSQVRIGLDGRTFEMLKFRSMRVDAEDQTGAIWAKRLDDRRTAIGTLLRKTSLDELPQLWNVLRGEMALVGPRPERPVFVDTFRSSIPHYMLRHKVKAGITGWAQVNGWRGDTDLDRRIECDLFYIRNWSYALDLKILTMTLWRGFINKNAY